MVQIVVVEGMREAGVAERARRAGQRRDEVDERIVLAAERDGSELGRAKTDVSLTAEHPSVLP